MTDTQTSEWIEHAGKGMPVDGDVLVLCRFRDGTDDAFTSLVILWTLAACAALLITYLLLKPRDGQ